MALAPLVYCSFVLLSAWTAQAHKRLFTTTTYGKPSSNSNFPRCSGRCPVYTSSHDYEFRKYLANSTWVSTTVYSHNFSLAMEEALPRLDAFFNKTNTAGQIIQRGYPIVVQMLDPCPKGSERKFTFSRFFSPEGITPLSTNPQVKVDFQTYDLKMFVKPVVNISNNSSSLQQLLSEVDRFANILKAAEKDVISGFFYYAIYENGSEIWIQSGRTYVKRTRCPPDDTSFHRMCGPNSKYDCPSFLSTDMGGFEIRNYSPLWVVSARAVSPIACSFGIALRQGYWSNSDYFRGKNNQNLKMNRTIPVLTKVSLNKNCKHRYRSQFYIAPMKNTSLGPPCPLTKYVEVQEISNLKVYVKVYNGRMAGPPYGLMLRFMSELMSKNISVSGIEYYIAGYHGHGPAFGRRLEIWIQPKNAKPCIKTLC